jgi:flagellar hook-associated protein 3 FlgL
MRIASTTVSDSMIRQIQQLTVDQSKLQSQVATGRRITNPEDDPAAVGRVLNLKSEQRQLAQYAGNSARALELAQASFSGLSGIKKISDRAGELMTLGNGALGSAAMTSYGTEVDQLIEQAVQLANTKFGNDYIFGGTAVDSAPVTVARDAATGRISAVAYAGNAQQSAIPLSESSSVAAGTTGATNAGVSDFISSLIALRDALLSGDGAAVTATQPGLAQGEDLIIGAMANNGGIQTRIQAAQAQQTDRSSSLDSLIANETDADLPSTVVKLSQAQTAYQAALASASKIMNLSLLDYLK